jgi:hypothetical protein
MTYLEIFQAELDKRGITWCQGCLLYNSHTRGFACKGTNVVHLKSSLTTRSSLHRGLHEIGHLVNDETRMKRWEKEQAANDFAETHMKMLGIPLPRAAVAKGRAYVKRMKRFGKAIRKGRKS